MVSNLLELDLQAIVSHRLGRWEPKLGPLKEQSALSRLSHLSDSEGFHINTCMLSFSLKVERKRLESISDQVASQVTYKCL